MVLTEKNTGKLIIIALLLMLAGHILLGFFIKRESTYILFAAFAGLFGLYYFVCRQDITANQFRLLIFGAVVLRLAWLFAFPNLSDDYARFVWDGRLLITGYNSFKYLPSDILKTGLPGFVVDRHLYEAMNSQTYYSCYPPLLQLVFAISSYIFPHNVYGNVIVLRLFNLAADLGSIWLLIQLCKKWKKNTKLVLLYALNPIVIAELTGNLHYEGMMIFFLLATIYCWEYNRYWLSTVCFAAAVVTKLIPLMFLPLIFFYLKGRKGFVFCVGVLVLSAVSFIGFVDYAVIHKFWSSINSYFQESEYNGSIYYLVRDIVLHFTGENKIAIIGPVLTLLSGLLIVLYAIWKRTTADPVALLKCLTWTMLIYYAFTTTVFPWYITPLIAFAAFTGYKFPLVWSGIIVLSYYTDRTTAFEESEVLILVEYLILSAVIVWDLRTELNNKKMRISL